MTAPASETRRASVASAAALPAGRSATLSLQDHAALTARFEKVKHNSLCPNCLDADDGTVVKGSLSLALTQSQSNRANGTALRPNEATTALTNDQFTSLSEQVAVLTTEIQKLKDENERLHAQREAATTQTNPVQAETFDNSQLVNMVRDLIPQQATVQQPKLSQLWPLTPPEGDLAGPKKINNSSYFSDGC